MAPSICRSVFAILVLAVIPALTHADVAFLPQGKPYTDEQKEWLAERANLRAKIREAATEDIDRAVTMGEKLLTAERQLFGNVHREIADSLLFLADLYYRQENFFSAVKVKDEVIEITAKLMGEKHWRVREQKYYRDRTAYFGKQTREVRRLGPKAHEAREDVARLYREGKYREAVERAAEAAELLEQALASRKNPDFAYLLLYEGRARMMLNDHTRAQAAFEKAAEIFLGYFGRDSLPYAWAQEDLGNFWRARTDYARAEGHYRTAVDIHEKSTEGKSLDLARTLRTLGALCSDVGQNARALEMARKALDVATEVAGARCDESRLALQQLCTVQGRMGRYEEAEKTGRQVLELAESTKGRDSWSYADAAYELGCVLADVGGKSEEALKLVRIFKDRHGEVYGKRTIRYTNALMKESVVLVQLKEFEAADETAQQCLALRREVFGPRNQATFYAVDHVDYVAGTWARHLAAGGNAEQGRKVLAQAAELLTEYYGANHWRTIDARKESAALEKYSSLTEEQRRRADESLTAIDKAAKFSDIGHFDKALPILEQGLKAREELFGPRDPLLVRYVFQTARAYHSIGSPTQAEPLYRRAAALCRELYGVENAPSLYGAVLFNLSSLYRERGRPALAVPVLLDSRKHIKATSGETSFSYGTISVNLAITWIEMGEFEKARTMLHEVLALCERTTGKQGNVYGHALHGLFLLYARNYDLKQADEYFEKADAVLRGVKVSEELISLHIDWGAYLAEHGNYKMAFPTLTWGRQTMGKYTSPWQQRMHVTCLRGLGMYHLGVKEYAKAEEVLREAVTLQRKKFGTDLTAYGRELALLAEVLDRQAEAALAAGSLDGYVAACRRQAETWTELAGERHWRAVDARSRLGAVEKGAALEADQRKEFTAALADVIAVAALRAEGRDADAEKPARRAQAALERLVGKDNTLYARHLMRLVCIVHRVGTTEEMEKLAQEQLELSHKVLSDDCDLRAWALVDLGQCEANRGKYERALKLLSEGANLLGRALGQGHSDYGQAQLILGERAIAAGSARWAESALRTAHAVLSQHQRKCSSDYHECLGSYGSILVALGDYDRAEAMYRRMYDFAGRAYSLQSAYRAHSALLLGGFLANTREDYKQAQTFLREAVNVRRKVFGDKSDAYAQALLHLASVLRKQDDALVAAPLFAQAIDIFSAKQGTESMSVATALLERGRMHLGQGELDEAETDVRKALAIREKVFGKDHFTYLECIDVLADLAWQKGDKKLAAQFQAEFLRWLEQGTLYNANWITESQQLVFGRNLQRELGKALSLQNAEETTPELYAHVLGWKGMVFSRQQRLRSVRETSTQETYFRRWEKLTGELATLALRVPYPEERDLWAEQVRQLSAERDRIEAQLARSMRGPLPKIPTPADLAGALPEKSALVDYVEYLRRVPSTENKGKWDEQRHLTAFVVRPGKPVLRVELGSAEAVSKAVDTWLAAINGRYEEGGRPPLSEVARFGRQVRKLVWAPLQEHLAGARTVLVSLDGPLTRAPLAALPGEDDEHFLIEEKALALVPVPALLPNQLASKKETAVGGLVAFGNVDYGGSPGTLDVRRVLKEGKDGTRSWLPVGFGKLANTGPEVDAVAETFASAFPDAPKTLFRGDEATEGAFRRRAPKARWLHLATHGFYAPDLMESALSTEGKPGSGSGLKFHPGLLSGLALAGANQRQKADEDDGILSAMEVAALDLSGVELAVLSACETAQGREAGGEGLLGLQRAFQVAGARSVVATLWPVSDLGTRLLMMRFYRNLWERKLSRAEALREAQLWMVKAARGGESADKVEADAERLPPSMMHPSFWAPFVLSGDWR